jgi:hypothetical protein
MLGYYRLVLGLDGARGTTSWVHVASQRYIGGWLGVDALALCDLAGNVRWLDRQTGVVIHHEAMSESVIACAVQSESAPLATSSQPRGLEAQLLRALQLEERDLLPIQLELLDDLASLPGDRATSALLELARDEGSFGISDRARELLASRRSGLNAVLHALRHNDPAQSTDSRLPLAAMARALRNGPVAEAATPLAAQLNEPRWRPAVLAEVALTLESTAGPEHRGALVWYLARLGCDTDYARASLAVARTLTRIGAGDVVKRIAQVSCGDGPMSAKLSAAVEAQSQPVYRPDETQR